MIDGKASEHAFAARKEAARKLSTNYEAVVRDITGGSPPKTQPTLNRLPGHEDEVDAALQQAVRLLIGRHPRERDVRTRPSNAAAAATWAATAEYLSGRIQSTREEVANTFGHEQRTPDMSEAAAAAMRAALSELVSEPQSA